MELDSSPSWMALTLTPGIAARLSARLLKEFGSPDEVFRAPLRRLEACNIPAPSAQAIVKKDSFKRAEKDLTNLRKVAAARVINWTEPEYPQTLLQIYDPPVMLYVRGNSQILNAPSLSIVGTRKPTLYGSQMAERLGCDLAVRGIVITSGLARGIDAIAHHGALALGGRAIGVLGTGIDVATRRKTRSCTRKFWRTGQSSANFRWAPILRRRIFRFAIGSLRACRWVQSLSKVHSMPVRSSLRGSRWNSAGKCSACPAM
jgi:DNA processing protein